jgi:hypothetical protein
VPEGLPGDELVMTTTLRAEARVTNHTYLLVDPRVEFKVIELDLPGSAADIGPLYEKSWNLAQPAALQLYSNAFDILLGTAPGATMTMRYVQQAVGGSAPGGSGPADPGEDYVEPPPPPPPGDLLIVPAEEFEVTAAPEPSSLALLAAGLAAVALGARRRARVR